MSFAYSFRVDVELAVAPAPAVQDPPNITTADHDVAPVHDTNNFQPVANQVTASTSSQQLGPSNSSTTDLEPAEVGNESQDAASPGIAFEDPAMALALQPSQTPELDAVPVQDIISPQTVANLENPSVSYPALNPPDVPASSNIPVYSTDGS